MKGTKGKYFSLNGTTWIKMKIIKEGGHKINDKKIYLNPFKYFPWETYPNIEKMWSNEWRTKSIELVRHKKLKEDFYNVEYTTYLTWEDRKNYKNNKIKQMGLEHLMVKIIK